MTAYRKTGAHNRSTGPIAGNRMRKALSAPANAGFWIAVPADLLNSPAWLAMSAQCRKFIDALMADFCAHGGMENGNLKSTYDQLQARGLRRKVILNVVVEAGALGIAYASRGQRSYGSRRAPSTYRLTWYGTPDGLMATHEWKAIKTAEEAETRVKNALEALEHERSVKRDNRERRAAQYAARMDAIDGAMGAASNDPRSGVA
jgi:hypothetical protein